jgi:serine/threonine-protein kinase 24/25/MST4
LQSSTYASLVSYTLSHTLNWLILVSQIDLESSEDDIQEIQQEISVLATCASAYVTQYKASFLKGHKLWIVMEFLGGGSCLDLVRDLSLLVCNCCGVPR